MAPVNEFRERVEQILVFHNPLYEKIVERIAASFISSIRFLNYLSAKHQTKQNKF